MYTLDFLYEFGNKDLDIQNEKDTLFNIALWGSIETKSLLLYKLQKSFNFQDYEIIIDLLNTIVDSTNYNHKSEYVYKYVIFILGKMVDEFFEKLKINSTAYYKIIILAIKIIKTVGLRFGTKVLINRMAQKMEVRDREVFLRHIFKQIRNQINFAVSPQTLNLLIDNILNEPEKNILDYSVFLNNLKYPPYLNQISFENIIKMAKKLNDFKNKIKSTKLREIFIEILKNYFLTSDIQYIIDNFERIKHDFYLTNLFVEALNYKLNTNPLLIEEKNIKKILEKLSIDKNSWIKVKIFSNENFPLHIRLNAFNTRKYSIKKVFKYLKNS